jgi:2Fe-2S iron-sulfur cluster protein
MNGRRLSDGGYIDRTRTLQFSFDGRSMQGFVGDTLASALIANGVTLVGRSFKYHRPRGIMSAGPEEPNALVELRSGARREPNTRATTAELYDGMEAQSQNRWPSLAFDLHAVNQLAGPLIEAGFYYKTFMWPASFWEKVYEPLIRKSAGLGRLGGEADPDRYEKAYAFCDLLVIGAGPAGLSAALTAGRAGSKRTSFSAAGCWPSPTRSMAARVSAGPQRSRLNSKPCRTSGSCGERPYSECTMVNSLPSSELRITFRFLPPSRRDSGCGPSSPAKAF